MLTKRKRRELNLILPHVILGCVHHVIDIGDVLLKHIIEAGFLTMIQSYG